MFFENHWRKWIFSIICKTAKRFIDLVDFPYAVVLPRNYINNHMESITLKKSIIDNGMFIVMCRFSCFSLETQTGRGNGYSPSDLTERRRERTAGGRQYASPVTSDGSDLTSDFELFELNVG